MTPSWIKNALPEPICNSPVVVNIMAFVIDPVQNTIEGTGGQLQFLAQPADWCKNGFVFNARYKVLLKF